VNEESYQITVARSAATSIAEQLPESVASAVIELIAGPPLGVVGAEQHLGGADAVGEGLDVVCGVGGHEAALLEDLAHAHGQIAVAQIGDVERHRDLGLVEAGPERVLVGVGDRTALAA